MKILTLNRFKQFLLILTVFVMLPNSVLAVELINNGNFETGDFTGWTVVDNGAGAFSVYTGTTSPISGSTILAPPEGSFAAVSDQGGPGSHLIYQDIFIPAGNQAFFNAVVYLENQNGTFFTPDTLSFVGVANQQMRVDVMDPAAPVDDVGAGVLLNIFRSEVGSPSSLGYTNISANLSAFAGQTIRIRIAEVDNQLFFQGSVDTVSVDAILPQSPTQIPTLSEWAIILLILSLGFIGLKYKKNDGYF